MYSLLTWLKQKWFRENTISTAYLSQITHNSKADVSLLEQTYTQVIRWSENGEMTPAGYVNLWKSAYQSPV